MPVDPIIPALPVLANLVGSGGKSEPVTLRAQVLNLPAQLAGAPTPVSVNGVVAESPIQGQLRITTPVGDVQLRTTTELPPGRAVTIITRPTAPTEVFLLPNATPAATAPANPSQHPAGATRANTPSPSPAMSSTNPLPPTTRGQAPIASAAPPLNGSPGASFNVPNPAAGNAAPANAATTTNAASANAGTTFMSAARPAPPVPVVSHPPTLSPASLVATFDVAVLPDRVGPAAYAPAASATPPATLLTLLTDLRRLVAANDPKLADRLLLRLPTADRAGAVALLALPVAARRNELATWLGRDIATLIDEEPAQTGKLDLLERIGSALTQAEERIDESGERTWRWRQLPVLENGQFIPLSIGVTSDRVRPDAGRDGKRPPSRIFEFVVEVALDALGLTRVEATYHQRRLDLVVQCETAIEQDGREQIVAAVAGVCEEFGIGGGCRFEPYRSNTAAGPVKV